MVKTIEMLEYDYKDFGNVYNKISREEKAGNLIKIKRGLYATEQTTNPMLVANYLFAPSYISFETALAYYGMIPERVHLIKSATYMKNKTKLYENKFGRFEYRDVQKEVYAYGIDIVDIDGNRIQIASREKALLDMLASVSPRNNAKEVEELLFDDLRINEEIFDELDRNKLDDLARLYNSTTIKNFRIYMRMRNDQ